MAKWKHYSVNEKDSMTLGPRPNSVGDIYIRANDDSEILVMPDLKPEYHLSERGVTPEKAELLERRLKLQSELFNLNQTLRNA